MEVYGWGRYPRIEADIVFPKNFEEIDACLCQTDSLIAQGFGRSYGDSSLSKNIVNLKNINRFITFDENTGCLTCEAGISLAEILDVFVPKGWFLPVTPGTRYVSVGGAIASDVHGKNHHLDGTFGEHVKEIRLLLGNGEFCTASAIQNSDLFHATCGGMGLTGIILSATIQMRRICSCQITETTIKASNLESVLNAFESHRSSTYSVAWIDCLAKGKDLGRSLLMLGEHAQSGGLETTPVRPITVPIDLPSIALNHSTVKLFNKLYYERISQPNLRREVYYERFFYPLDKLSNWNRLYGKAGFTQYQFVLPKECGQQGLTKILEKISRSGRGSFLAVLKVFGKGNSNYMSFPLEGYTLALDFKADVAVFDLLNEMDRMVLDHGGRIYLTKDARMSEATFKSSYPNWEEFQAVRGRYHALEKFASTQSIRLGL